MSAVPDGVKSDWSKTNNPALTVSSNSTSGGAGWFSNVLSGIGNAIGGFFNWLGIRQTNKVNKQISDDNLAAWKAENDLTRERENDANQRAVKDLHAAGLSATLAAGNPASAQALRAPQSEFYYQNPYSGISESINNVFSGIKNISEAKYLNSLTNLNNIDAQTRFETNKAKQQYYVAQSYLEKRYGDLFDRTFEEQINKIINENVYTREQIENIVVDTVNKNIQTKILSYTEKNLVVKFWLTLLGGMFNDIVSD